jgi:hypothetical protein
MTARNLSLTFLSVLLAACVTAPATVSTTSARTPGPSPSFASHDGRATSEPESASRLDDELVGDSHNCGCCATRCTTDQLCIEGACVARPSACIDGCDANFLVCNEGAARCVGNGSPSLNLCRLPEGLVSGTALPCGTSGAVTIVDTCNDSRNCGNCGIACPAGECFWGVCR